MKKYSFCFLILLSVSAFAQYKVTFMVEDNAMYKADKLYAAGTFNGWNPSDKNYIFTKNENDKWELNLPNINAGDYSFKFTQGSWQTVEVSINGADKANRLMTIKSDTILYFTTLGWQREAKPRNHTASKNVHIISDSFFIPQLKRKRKIWIYLPSNYANSKELYPVLYMHDGQNLFDEFTAGYGEWNVDETLDSLQKVTGKYAIIVGIDHGDKKRLVEYNPYFTKEYGMGQGEQYTDFIVKTLKPFIDKNYRTKKNVKSTAIAGSSLGGLISTYAVLKYPTVFGSVGIFSPAYWIAPSLEKFSKKQLKKSIQNRYWFYGGEKEGYTMMDDMLKMYKIISTNTSNTIIEKDKDGQHNEAAWGKWFPIFYLWWMNNI
jgi:predicted alpha/beta superfamily hydrolase